MNDGGAVCLANIGPRERRKRLRSGIAAFGLSVVMAAVLGATGSSPAWRLTLFPPLWVAGLGFFQARDKT